MKTHQSPWTRSLLAGVTLIGACLTNMSGAIESSPVLVTASALQQSVRVGEPVPVKVEIRNLGSRPIDPEISYPRLFGQFKAEALQSLDVAVGPSSVRRAQQPIMPGESKSWTVVLNRYLKLGVPGSYTVNYSVEIVILQDAVSGVSDRVIQASADEFEITIVPGSARGEVLRLIADRLASTEENEAALGYDMLLHTEINGALELLVRYASDARFPQFRRDTILRLAAFLPDSRAVDAIVSVASTNDAPLMLIAVQAFEQAGQRFPPGPLKKWYAQSNEMTRESLVALLSQWKLPDYVRIVQQGE